MPAPMMVHFYGGAEGRYRVLHSRAVAGEPLPAVERIAVVEAPAADVARAATYRLRGVTSHQRYVESREGVALRSVQAGLERPEARCAAMIPISKSTAWWDLAQDERRAIFEAQSRHIAGTLKYLPAIARRLHHSRDLGEPFDFVTWFEFAPEHSAAFDELLQYLRGTEEWRYVVREVELRLLRED